MLSGTAKVPRLHVRTSWFTKMVKVRYSYVTWIGWEEPAGQSLLLLRGSKLNSLPPENQCWAFIILFGCGCQHPLGVRNQESWGYPWFLCSHPHIQLVPNSLLSNIFKALELAYFSLTTIPALFHAISFFSFSFSCEHISRKVSSCLWFCFTLASILKP